MQVAPQMISAAEQIKASLGVDVLGVIQSHLAVKAAETNQIGAAGSESVAPQ